MNWTRQITPKSMGCFGGWMDEMDRCYTDQSKGYCVMIRTIDTPIGKVDHACIIYMPPNKPHLRNSKDGQRDIPWRIKQRIKNELFGEERTAIEVFPAESKLVDSFDVYHLWILPPDFQMPFTLKR